MFVDKAEITIKAGNGGNGACSFRREAFVPKGGPNGGDGGNGGDIAFIVDPGAINLLDFTMNTRFIGHDGVNGKSKDMTGRNGKTLYIKVPRGTIVRLAGPGDLLADVCEDGKEYIVAKGGKGGRGNSRFATSTNQAPREHEPGEKTVPMDIYLELKIVADVGLVGYPNAGKSTILSDISGAKPKIAPYPFTTLQPVVGVVEYEDFTKLTVADIPGLVDGAHANVGLGHEFLRHVERTRMLVYVLDMAGTDGRDPVDDLHALERELELYSEGLSKRVSLIIANKMDVPESEENLKRLVNDVKKRLPIFPMSAQEDPDYEELKEVLRDFLAKTPDAPDATQTVLVNPQPIPAAKNHDMVEEIYDEDDLSGNGVEIIYAD